MICDTSCAECLDKPYKCGTCSNQKLYPDNDSELCKDATNSIPDCVNYDQIQYMDKTGINTLEYICTKCADGFYRQLNTNKIDYEYICFECESTEETTHCSECDMRRIFVGGQESTEYYCAECEPGYFIDLVVNKCKKCPQNCIVCSAENTCQVCAEKMYLKVENGDTICAPCPENCLTCISGDHCDICEKGYEFFDDQCVINLVSNCLVKKADGQCDSCIDGFYVFAGMCRTCSLTEDNQQSHCNRCYGIENDSLTNFMDKLECADCQPGFYLTEEYQCNECGQVEEKRFCVEEVMDNVSKIENQCRTVDIGTGECTSCLLDYALTVDRKCRMCPTEHPGGCTCAVNENCDLPELEAVANCIYCGNDCACAACREGYLFSNGKCLLECMDGYVVGVECYYCADDEYLLYEYDTEENELGLCQKMIPKCVEQHEENVCLHCEVPTDESSTCWYLKLEHEPCLNGYYSEEEWCKPCGVIEGCLECNNGVTCSLCKNGIRAAVCKIENCRDQEVPCTLCESGYFLTENGTKCVDCRFLTKDSMVDGEINPYIHLYDSASCSCGLNCASCTIDGYCAKCKDHHFLTTDGQCERCNFFCTNCTELERCYGCIDGFFLDRFSECQKCFPGCAQCLSEDVCNLCDRGWHLIEDKNYEPDAQGIGRLVERCLQCSPNMSICELNVSGYRGVAALECKEGWYLENFQCHKCLPQCITCNNAYFCQSCVHESIERPITQEMLDQLNDELQQEESSEFDFSLNNLQSTGNVECNLCGVNREKRESADSRQDALHYECVCREYNVLLFGKCVSVVEIGFLAGTAFVCIVPLFFVIIMGLVRAKKCRYTAAK